MSQVLSFDNVLNVRDFGGLKCEDGALVKLGCLFRGAQLSKMSDADRGQFQENEVSLIVDLRYRPERDRQKTVWDNEYVPQTLVYADELCAGADTKMAPHEAFIVDELRTAHQAHDYMLRSYGQRPHDPGFVAICRDALHMMAKTGAHIYIHCAAGKDRTGSFAALILLMLGVHRDDVMEEYMRTQSALDIEPIIQFSIKKMQTRFGKPFDADVLRPFFSVCPEYLEQSLEAIGNVDHYLSAVLALNGDHIANLKTHYVG